jgi:hypothetical protein
MGTRTDRSARGECEKGFPLNSAVGDSECAEWPSEILLIVGGVYLR